MLFRVWEGDELGVAPVHSDVSPYVHLLRDGDSGGLSRRGGLQVASAATEENGDVVLWGYQSVVESKSSQ